MLQILTEVCNWDNDLFSANALYSQPSSSPCVLRLVHNIMFSCATWQHAWVYHFVIAASCCAARIDATWCRMTCLCTSSCFAMLHVTQLSTILWTSLRDILLYIYSWKLLLIFNYTFFSTVYDIPCVMRVDTVVLKYSYAITPLLDQLWYILLLLCRRL